MRRSIQSMQRAAHRLVAIRHRTAMTALANVQDVVLRAADDGRPIALSALRGHVLVLVLSRHLG